MPAQRDTSAPTFSIRLPSNRKVGDVLVFETNGWRYTRTVTGSESEIVRCTPGEQLVGWELTRPDA